MAFGRKLSQTLFLSFAAAGAALGEGTAPPAPLWVVGCSSQPSGDVLTCEVSQSLVATNAAGQSRRLAVAAFRRDVGKTDTRAAFSLPYDLDLTVPPAVSVDGKSVATLSWQSCDGNGCYAAAEAANGWLKALRAGEKMDVAVKARGGRDMTFSFQAKDFTRAEKLMP